jgi:hypothetical protein
MIFNCSAGLYSPEARLLLIEALSNVLSFRERQEHELYIPTVLRALFLFETLFRLLSRLI